MSKTLFDPLKMGDYTLKNRIIMAPMTRGRTGSDGIPTELVAQYYAQRATAGLIISEAVAVNARGDGWPGAPGIYTDAQQKGWENVASAIHAKEGLIFMQLWHMGRAVLSEYINGMKPIAPSAIKADGEIPNSQGVPTAFDTPMEMTKADIEDAKTAFVDAAKNAIKAGIDGVELHAANGFLIDTFLREGTNKRTDEYGGSLKNRCRFLLEVVDAVVEAIGAGKTAVRFSPTNAIFGMYDSDPEATFTYAAKALSERDLAYLHILEPANDSGSFLATDIPNVLPAIRAQYDGVIIQNGAMTQTSGQAAIVEGLSDAIAYGAPYIANPDLVERFKTGTPLAESDPETFYTSGSKGYTDYPVLDLTPAE